MKQFLKEADIIIIAIGSAKYIQGEWLKPGCTIIDVGVNVVEEEGGGGGEGEEKKKKRRVVGDVDFESVRGVAGWVTPVPGGVGPMTIAMLMRNTLLLTKRQVVKKEEESLE